MTTCRTILVSCAHLVFAANLAAAADLRTKTSLACATTAAQGSTLTMNVHLESRECAPLTVRLVTAIAGNANGTLAGVGVYGPVVANQVIIPAATDNGATCNLTYHFCNSYGGTCNSNADCACLNVTPSSLDLPSQSAPPAVPAALVGTVEGHLLITEWQGTPGKATRVDQCLVEVTP
ncbi:MAG TPA: hypothetical protein VKH41_10470 [Myxococcota bacterium]|nr:hypothetical protein [Myxococcota bacterium]